METKMWQDIDLWFSKEESDITLAFNFKAIQTKTFVYQDYYSAYKGTNKMLENQTA